jgi:uncharacterized membrane protein
MFNHPLHPAFVHFPIGAWGVATGLDGLVLIGLKPAELWGVSTGLMGVGIILALLAMGAGIIDLIKISKRQNGLLDKVINHIMVMAIVWCIYLVSFIMRLNGESLSPPSTIPIILSILAFIGLILGGWLGGDLVYRHGANVTPVVKKEDELK